jgi:hypothetical protein
MTTAATSPLLTQWFDARRETMESAGRQRDQKRQGAVARSGTKPQTRYGYESSGAESHVPVVCTCLYLTTAWLAGCGESVVDQ